MSITATPETYGQGRPEDEDGFSLGHGRFVAWHDERGPKTGFTVGIVDEIATDPMIAQTLNEVAAILGDSFQPEDSYSDMGVTHFVFGA